MNGDTLLDLRITRSAALARNWWAIVLRGTLALAFAVLAFISPAVTLGTLVLLFGAYAVVDGVFALVAALRAVAHHERWMLLAAEGAVGLLAGAVALYQPVLTVVFAVALMALWAVTSGTLMLLAAFRLHTGHGNWLLALAGVVSLVWGALLFSRPLEGGVLLTLWLGVYALVFGVSMIALGLRLRHRHLA